MRATSGHLARVTLGEEPDERVSIRRRLFGAARIKRASSHGSESTTEAAPLKTQKAHTQTAREDDDDAAAVRNPQPEELPLQRHEPLHRRSEQHGSDHHGAQLAAGRPAAGGGQGAGPGLPEGGRGRGGHVQLLPAAQVHPQGHRVGGPARRGRREAQRGHDARPLPLLHVHLILRILVLAIIIGGGGRGGGGRRLGEAVPVPPDRTARGAVQAHAAGRLPNQALQAGDWHRRMGPVSAHRMDFSLVLMSFHFTG